MKDSPAREEELCNLEVKARKLGEYVEDRQTQMLVQRKATEGDDLGRSDLRLEDLT